MSVNISIEYNNIISEIKSLCENGLIDVDPSESLIYTITSSFQQIEKLFLSEQEFYHKKSLKCIHYLKKIEELKKKIEELEEKCQ